MFWFARPTALAALVLSACAGLALADPRPPAPDAPPPVRMPPTSWPGDPPVMRQAAPCVWIIQTAPTLHKRNTCTGEVVVVRR